MNRNATPIPTNLKCSLCDGPLTAYPDDGKNVNRGVTVICLNPCLATCHESPFGHAGNVKEAYDTLCHKFRK